MAWTILYNDGTEFSHLDGEPSEAPRPNVACVVQDDRILWNSDCYCWEDGEWVEHDRWSTEWYLDNDPHPVRLRGYTLTKAKFALLYDRAKALKVSPA